MKKKVFVTGADGMLGSSICRELLKQGYAVKAMCLPGRKTGTLTGLSIKIVHGNISDKKDLLNQMKNCHHVIHVAALTTVWPRRVTRVVEVNLKGTKNVMEAAEELNLQRMIHIGSASSFAHGPKNNPGNETSAFNGHKFGMDYINSKYQAQQMLLQRHKDKGFPVIIINPTFMIGPYDFGPTSGKILLTLYKKKLMWYNKGGKNFVYSVDVAKAAVNAITMGEPGQCYIAGSENLEYKEFFQKFYTVINKKSILKNIPTPALIGLGFLNSAFSRVVRKPPVLSYGMALMAKENQYFSSEKARNILKMPQTPIEEGMRECVEWFKANKYL